MLETLFLALGVFCPPSIRAQSYLMLSFDSLHPSLSSSLSLSLLHRAFADALLAINKNFIHSQEVHLQWERLKALRTTGNECLAGGQLGYSEGPAARPIGELRSLNGIRILYPQTISNNYGVARRGDRECVFVLRVWDVF